MAKLKLKMLKPGLRALGSPVATLTPPRAKDRRLRGSVWMKTRERILKRDGGLCKCADCSMLDRIRLAHEVDHVTPLWKGGSDADSNLAAINVECHKVKTEREERERRALGL